MRKIREQIKLLDVVIIVFFLLISFLPWMIFSQTRRLADNEIAVANILINGVLVESFVLDDDTFVTREFTELDGLLAGQYNVVEVASGQIRIQADNTPNQIAVRTGWISQPGQMSISLPHRFVIQIERRIQDSLDPEHIIIP